MKLFNQTVFDENIASTATTWYTSAEHNDRLGLPDVLMIQAVATNVTGTTPTLTLQVEHCADGQNWINLKPTGGPEIAAAAINTTPVNYAYVSSVTTIPLSFVRFRISLGGTSPQCRLKVLVTGRTY